MEHIFYQNPDGSFNREVTGNSSPSPFFTAIIAQGLALLPKDSGFAAQQQAAISYLLSQQSPQRSYNYLPRTSNKSLYPDDLDDTASALTALSLDSPSHINGESWAHIVTLLTATELEPGGPYRTWLVPKDAPPIWNDVDLVVNCNIEYLLTLHNITLPKLKEFIALPRTYEEISSPYYPDKMVIYYFLSRVLSHTLSKPYIALIKDQKASNPLQAALKILTLSNLGANILLTLKEQKVIINTPWKAEPFCLDFGSSTTQYMAGSAELTTIFCLQAQDLLRKASEAPFTTSTSSPEKSIRRLLNDRFMQCEEPLRSVLTNQLNSFWSKDIGNSIALLTYQFNTALVSPAEISETALLKLCAATVHGWIAYTIYDDFLDSEGVPTYLPAANLCLREVTRLFSKVMVNKPAFEAVFHSLMDTMEEANSFEVTNCRFDRSNTGLTIMDIAFPTYPSVNFLAHRSAGHYLGPLALLYSTGVSPDHIVEFFTHYLTARQLNDDAHDFEQDLLAGRLTYVVINLFLYARQKEQLASLSIKELLPHLRTYFWQEYILIIAREIKSEISSARLSLQKCTSFLDPLYLEMLLTPLEKAANTAISEHSNVTDFLKHYEGSTPEHSPP